MTSSNGVLLSRFSRRDFQGSLLIGTFETFDTPYKNAITGSNMQIHEQELNTKNGPSANLNI